MTFSGRPVFGLRVPGDAAAGEVRPAHEPRAARLETDADDLDGEEPREHGEAPPQQLEQGYEADGAHEGDHGQDTRDGEDQVEETARARRHARLSSARRGPCRDAPATLRGHPELSRARREGDAVLVESTIGHSCQVMDPAALTA